MKTRFAWWVMLAMVAALLLIPAQQPTYSASDEETDVAPGIENILPADTLAVVSINNTRTLWDKAKRHPLYSFWKEEAVQKFFEEPLRELTETLDKAEQEAELEFTKLMDLPSGQVALVLHKLDGSASEERLDIAASMFCAHDGSAEKTALLEKLLENVTAIAVAKGANVSKNTVKVGDATIVELTTEDAPFPLNFTYTVTPKFCMVGVNNIEYTKLIIENYGKKLSDCLANDAIYASAKEATGKDADMYLYVRLRPLVDLASKVIGELIAMFGVPIDVDNVFDTLGLKGMQSLSIGVTLQNTMAQYAFHVGLDENRKGIARIMALPQVSKTPPTYVPVDASEYWQITLEGKVIWEEVNKIVASMGDMVSGGFQQVIGKVATDFGINIEEDVMNQLETATITYYSRIETPVKDEKSKEAVTTVTVKDADAFADTLSKIMDAIASEGSASIEMEDYKGHSIQTVEVSGYDVDENGDFVETSNQFAAWTFHDKMLVIGNNPEAVKKFIDRVSAETPAKSLGDNPVFQEYSKNFLSAKCSSVSWHDAHSVLDFTEFRLKQLDEHRDKGVHVSNDLAVLFDPSMIFYHIFDEMGFDMDLRPDVTLLKKYMRYGVGDYVVDAKGVTSHYYQFYGTGK